MSWKGAQQILQFNRRSYASAVLVLALCALLWQDESLSRPLLLLVGLVTLYFSLASLLVSHWIYDLSPIATWTWLPGWLGSPVKKWAMVQAGFDSTHGAFEKAVGEPPLFVLDLYGRPGAGGASVQAARLLFPPGPVITEFPAGPAQCQWIMAIFAVHEFHSSGGRENFFKDMAQALVPGGHLVVVEHLRDAANFVAFGPGFFHFYPAQEWRRCAEVAGLLKEKETSITPFVHAFLWRKP